MHAPGAVHPSSDTTEEMEAAETVSTAAEESAQQPDDPALLLRTSRLAITDETSPQLSPPGHGPDSPGLHRISPHPTPATDGSETANAQSGQIGDAAEAGHEQGNSTAGSLSVASAAEPGTPRQVEEDENVQAGTDTPKQVCWKASRG